MGKKIVSLLVLTVFLFSATGVAQAADQSLTRGAASLIIPGVGQYMNGELDTQSGKIKTGAMILIEVGAIVTTAVVGGVCGYPQIWIGLGILILNHVWSGSDAYMKAPAGPETSLKGTAATQR